MHTNSILVVDDSPHHREELAEMLEREGYPVHQAQDGVMALRVLEEKPIDLALIDLQMPRINGIELLRHMEVAYPDTKKIVISGTGTVPKAVEATKLGAVEFIEKQFDPAHVLHLIRKTLTSRSIAVESNGYAKSSLERYGMIGTTASMRRVFRLIDQASRVSAKVLIAGENGTGKELVALAIHKNSSRSGKPFVPVNCASIPEELVESTLFGHEKGSFTGAHTRRIGRFEEAEGGTLFLDEIGEMTLATQAKLLRVLETGVIRSVGSEKPTRVDVRIIAATNKKLLEEVEAGNFRRDLYYRLAVVEIEIPPLRDRWEDIPALVEHCLERSCRAEGLEPKTLGTGALVPFTEYRWKGNVRELKNVVERLVAYVSGTKISVKDVENALLNGSYDGYGDGDGGPLDRSLRAARFRWEARYIRQMLEEHSGKVAETAAALGIDRSHLWRKLKVKG